MGFLERLFNRPPPAPTPKPSARAFEAAVFNRLTAGWMTSSASLDQDLRAGLDTMRARAREMAQNNEYATRFLAMVRANVVGPQGFRLIARVENRPGQSDDLANTAIETAWWDWGRMGVGEVSGRHTHVSSLHAACNHLARDGEVLIRLWRGAQARNRFNFGIQLIDPARLATTMNAEPTTAGGNMIRMGVEMDALMRPIAYHIRPHLATSDTERVLAEDIIHAFLPGDAEQSRGIPWMHAAIRRLHDLGGYREAAIIAARIGASKMGFYQVAPDTNPEDLADGYAATGVPYTSAEPGEFGVLPPGVTFENFNPDYPHDQFDAFIKAALRGIAAGLGVSYHGLANDLTEVSFSSIRSGTLEERDQWMVLQDWFAAAIVERIYTEWLRMALMSGAILMPNGSALPAAKLDKFAAHSWQPRRWEWVDPESDANAIVTRLENSLTTLTHEAAKQGLDLEEILQTRARERELFAKYGLEPAAPPPAAATPAQE